MVKVLYLASLYETDPKDAAARDRARQTAFGRLSGKGQKQ